MSNSPFFATNFSRPFKDQSRPGATAHVFGLDDLEALLTISCRERGAVELLGAAPEWTIEMEISCERVEVCEPEAG